MVAPSLGVNDIVDEATADRVLPQVVLGNEPGIGPGPGRHALPPDGVVVYPEDAAAVDAGHLPVLTRPVVVEQDVETGENRPPAGGLKEQDARAPALRYEVA